MAGLILPKEKNQKVESFSFHSKSIVPLKFLEKTRVILNLWAPLEVKKNHTRNVDEIVSTRMRILYTKTRGTLTEVSKAKHVHIA